MDQDPQFYAETIEVKDLIKFLNSSTLDRIWEDIRYFQNTQADWVNRLPNGLVLLVEEIDDLACDRYTS